MKSIAKLLALALITGSSSGSILVDTFTDHNLNNNTIDLNNLGWQSKAFWTAGPSGDSIQTSQSFGSDGVNTFGIAQSISVGAATGNSLRLQFDWTPDATATQAVSLELRYQLVAWDTGGTAPTTGQVLFNGMNFFGTTVGGENTGMPIGTHTYDIAGGNHTDTANGGTLFIHPGNGQVFPSSNIFASTAGVTANFDQTFSVALGANTDISDYDYIGVRFHVGDSTADASDPGNDGGALIDNISLTVVPEPSSSALIGLAGLALMARRRRRD